MAKRFTRTEEKTTLVGAVVPLDVRAVIEEMAIEDERPICYVARQLLEQSPRLRERLEQMRSAETQAA